MHIHGYTSLWMMYCHADPVDVVHIGILRLDNRLPRRHPHSDTTECHLTHNTLRSPPMGSTSGNRPTSSTPTVSPLASQSRNQARHKEFSRCSRCRLHHICSTHLPHNSG
eukprot:m.23448 g.23448  ORF g.23448 m.23448 type:complete len:110 (-) comp12939_c0_seq8:644-973(-)